jgi:Zn-dependent protease with chaperone function
MPEARRATAALAALVALAVGAALLLAYHLAHALPISIEAIARMCRLPGAVQSLDRATAIAPGAWLAIGLLLGGLVFALIRLTRTVSSSSRVVARLVAMPAAAVSSAVVCRVAARATRLGLPTSPVVTRLDGRPAAFTIGLFRPRIVVSEVVVEALTEAELDALLLHEAAHARRRDPLRLVIAGFCRDLLFFLPVSYTLFRRVGEAQERAADDAAAVTAGPLEVAGALLALLKLAGRQPEDGLVPAAAGADPEARIRRLLDVPEARPSRRAFLSRAGATALVSTALLASLVGMPVRAADTTLAGCCVVMTAAPGSMAPYC